MADNFHDPEDCSDIEIVSVERKLPAETSNKLEFIWSELSDNDNAISFSSLKAALVHYDIAVSDDLIQNMLKTTSGISRVSFPEFRSIFEACGMK
jgi:Ca2+-binding EF-hand superfamily protein